MLRRRVSMDELLMMIRIRMRAHRDCADCVPTQLSPVKPVAGGVNWQVLEQPPCSGPCQAMMLDVSSALAAHYDVRWPRPVVRSLRGMSGN